MENNDDAWKEELKKELKKELKMSVSEEELEMAKEVMINFLTLNAMPDVISVIDDHFSRKRGKKRKKK